MFPLNTVPKETARFKDLTSDLHQIDAFPCAIGEHSDIFRARRVNDERQEHTLALKTLRSGSSSNPKFESELQKKLVDLGDNWVQLCHPHVAKIHGVAYGSGRLPALVMDYYQAGSIASYMKSRTVTDAEKMKWVQEIALGLKYLHRRKTPVVHGDLRGANIFLNAEGKCVLADVGMVYVIDMPEFVMMKSAATCRFTAPELMDPNLPRQTAEGPECTIQSDVFSFAMTVIQIFSGEVPFSQRKNDTSIIPLIVQGERPELPQHVQDSPALARLVQDCWAPEPNKRPNMSEVCYRLGLTSYFRYLLEWIGLL